MTEQAAIGWRIAQYRHVVMTERGGVLEMRLHSGEGPLLWGTRPHEELGHAFSRVAADEDVRVVIITGTGDAFCNEAYRPAQRPPGDPGTSSHAFSPRLDSDSWSSIYHHAERLLFGLLDIKVPVIAAVNGPATIHAELALLSDIVLSTPDAVFQETHFSIGVVPGDGVHVIWPLLLGPARGRYYLYTGKQITAAEALSWGMVSEVVPPGELRDRAWELARDMAQRPMLTLRYSRALLMQETRRRMRDALPYGLALEGLGANSHWPGVPDE